MLSFLFIILGLGSFAQSFVIDTTFQPFFDIRSGNDKGYVYDVLELPSGNIFISGTFDFGVPNNQYHRGLTSVTYNGNRNYNYGGSSSGEGFMRFITDTSFMVGHNFFRTKDTNGQTINIPQGINALYTVQCRTGVPYFYKDGSSLVANSISNSGMPCEIINNPDTFPGRHIIKVNPQGLWDSTFVHDATNKEPEAFIPYDSNRIIIYGNPSSFTHYDSVAVNGICRIFLDGRLDTTFNLALNTNQFYNTLNYTIVIPLIEPNGKFFLTGNYYLGNDSIPSNIARFNPDGSIDSSFLFQQGPVDTINNLGGCG